MNNNTIQLLSKLEAYENTSDLQKREIASNWRAAIGLQKVDGLNVSDYLLELAIRNIEGEISMNEVTFLLNKRNKS